MKKRAVVWIAVVLCSVGSKAQTKADAPDTKPQPAVATYRGCVTAGAHDPTERVLKTGDVCVELAGKFKPSQLTGHEVTLIGSMLEAHGTEPMSLQVTATRAVGPACTETCVLEPPGTRGVHKNESHGHQGGTAGVVGTDRPPQ